MLAAQSDPVAVEVAQAGGKSTGRRVRRLWLAVHSAMNNMTLGKSSTFPIAGNKATLSSQDYD